MNDFTASNGYVVRPTGGGMVVESEGGPLEYSAYERSALREFFRAEEDERLERWRVPYQPNLVVYHWGQPAVAGVMVLDEMTGTTSRILHRGDDPENMSADYKAARAYFDAHPEPKPWHDAQPGEVWVLESNGYSGAALVEASHRYMSGVGFRMVDDGRRGPGREAKYIKSARRIWPEESP